MVVITGGSRGIGASAARQAAAAGYAVCLTYRSDRAAAEQVAGAIAGAGGRALALQADVGVETDVLRIFDTATSALGPLTALVNNAGILEPQMRVEDMSAARLERVFRVNLIGAFLCAREAVRRMARSRGGQGGAIVNVSSAAARLGSANEYVDYAASKGAIDTLTLGLAREVGADGIRVNAVRPGLINTRIHADGGEPGRIERLRSGVPLQRGGEPDEVAAAIMWLLSPAASYCTGAILDVSGGR